MSTQREPESIFAAWLDEGPTELPDQNRRAIVTAIRTIPQRRRGFGLPWRFSMMNGYTRFALAAVAVLVVAVGGIYLVRPGSDGSFGGPGPSPSPTPQPTPTPSPSPTPEPPTAGTITLTDAGCTWVGNTSPVTDQTRIVIAVRNDTATFGNFTLYKLNEGRTWDEAAAWVTAENEALVAGEPRDVPADFATEYATADALAGLENRLVATVSTGTYGVMCSANEPPPGAIFNVYLVGPLEVE